MALAVQVLDAVLAKSFDSLRWLLEDIGDDDCFWEPGDPCWSVRRREDATVGWGTGAWVCEDRWPPPDPLPLTTIAWRMAHLAAWTDIYRNWTFEDQTLGLLDFDVPGTRDGLAAWLFAGQDRFRAEVRVKALEIKVLPGNIPEDIKVDVTELGIGQSLHVSDLTVPDAEILTDAGVTVAVVPESSNELPGAGRKLRDAKFSNPGVAPCCVPVQLAGIEVDPLSTQLFDPPTMGSPTTPGVTMSRRKTRSAAAPSRWNTLLCISTAVMPSNSRNTEGTSLLGCVRTTVLLTKR